MTQNISVTDLNTMQLVNYAKSKEIYGIVLIGTTKNGYYQQRLDQTIKLNPNASHKVYLQSFAGWSNIPNIKTGKNDNFTYINGTGVTKTITFPQGAYSLPDIITYIQNGMFNNGDFINNNTTPASYSYSIKIATFTPTQSVQITLSANFKVDFTPSNSIASLIGFDNVLLAQNTTFTSTKLVDILPTQCINILCNIANGFVYNGKSSNILYSFNNDIPRGSLFSKEPNPVVPCICNTKNIDVVSITFQDQEGNTVNFNEEQFVVRIVIEQM